MAIDGQPTLDQRTVFGGLDRSEYERLTRELSGYCYRMLGSPFDAEDAVQDTMMRAWREHERFEGRSSLRTWLLTILVNRARTAGVRESRSVAIGDAAPAVDRARFDATGAWASPPEHWVEDAENRLSAAALATLIRGALTDMPERQRAVITLHDVDGLRSDEVCEILALTPANQRVLLHRGRSHLRQALESALGENG